MGAVSGKYLKKFERGKILIDLIGRRRLGRDDRDLVRVCPLGDETRPDLTRFAFWAVTVRAAHGNFGASQLSACRHVNLDRMYGGHGIEIACQSLLKKIERGALGRRIGLGQVDGTDGEHRVATLR